MPRLEDAIILAAEVHRQQTDKAGLPYILHPLRVMCSFLLPDNEDARIAAVLHDVVEDTWVTLVSLRERGFSEVAIEAVDALTRRKDGSETYGEYIERVAQNPIAIWVKLADLQDNLDPRRRSTGTVLPELIERYREAFATLSNKLP